MDLPWALRQFYHEGLGRSLGGRILTKQMRMMQQLSSLAVFAASMPFF
jgi:hypothetical protein